MPSANGRQPTDAVYLHPDDNICVAARNLAAGAVAGDRRHDGRAGRAGPARAQDRRAADPPRASTSASTARSSARRPSDIAAGRVGPFAQSGERRVRPRLRQRHGRFRRRRRRSPAARSRAIAGPAARRARGTTSPSSRRSIARPRSAGTSPSGSTSRALRDFPNIDGVIAVKHGGGCGMQYQGLQHEMLNRTLAGMAKHPNIGGYLLVGLGCEQATMRLPDAVAEPGADRRQRQRRPPGPPVLSMQDLGGTAKTVEAGVQARRRAAAASERRAAASRFRPARSSWAPTAAAPTATAASPATRPSAWRRDMLVACGGTSVLAETTEIYGAEHLLTRRAVHAAGRRQAARADQVVAVAHRPVRRRDRQQPVGRQQGRRPDDDRRKVARRRRQGRLDRADRGLSSTPSRSRPRASSSWTRPASIRPASRASSPAAAT